MECWIRPLPARWAVVLGTVLLGLMLGLASYRVVAVEPEKTPAPAEEAKPPAAKTEKEKAKEIEKEQAARMKRESLRYGGKNFDQWHTEMVTELKATIRVDGMKAFAAFGANGYGREATEAILEMMRGYDVASPVADDDSAVVEAGYRAIDKIGTAAIPALTTAVKDENRNARRFAIKALWWLRPKDARPAVPALLQAIKHDDPETREQAIITLAKIDREAKGFVPALIGALRDERSNVRNRAVNELGNIGKSAKPGIPALLEVLRDKKVQMRFDVLLALRKIGAGAEAVAAISHLLRDENLSIRRSAYEFVQSLGADAKEAVPALIAVVKDTSDGYRIWAIGILGTIGPAAKEAVPALTELLSADDANLTLAVKKALKQISRDPGR